MFTFRRWWSRHGSPIVATFAVLLLALFLRLTDGALINEIYQGIASPFQTKVDTEQLLVDARIRDLEGQVLELKEQNKQLKKLLDYSRSQDVPTVTAPIIGRSPDYWWQQITLGRGGKDGITKGDTVIGVGGLVGRVVSSTNHTSTVLLLSDPNSKIGAKVSRSGNLGYIQGTNASTVIMRFFEKVPDVKVGDLITTSEVSQLFPEAISIGKVMKIDNDNGPAPEATIEINVPLNTLEWVLVRDLNPLNKEG